MNRIKTHDSLKNNKHNKSFSKIISSIIATATLHQRVLMSSAIDLDSKLNPNYISPGIRTLFTTTMISSIALMMGYDTQVEEYEKRINKFETKVFETFSDIFDVDMKIEDLDQLISAMKLISILNGGYSEFQNKDFIEKLKKYNIELPTLVSEMFRISYDELEAMAEKFQEVVDKNIIASEISNNPELKQLFKDTLRQNQTKNTINAKEAISNGFAPKQRSYTKLKN